MLSCSLSSGLEILDETSFSALHWEKADAHWRSFLLLIVRMPMTFCRFCFAAYKSCYKMLVGKNWNKQIDRMRVSPLCTPVHQWFSFPFIELPEKNRENECQVHKNKNCPKWLMLV